MSKCGGLIDRFLELIDPRVRNVIRNAVDRCFLPSELTGLRDSQLLEIAVGYIVTTPVRYRIELNAMRELHPSNLRITLEL